MQKQQVINENKNNFLNANSLREKKKEKLNSINKKFLQVNFETIYILLKLKVNSYEMCIFQLIFSFLFLIISNLYDQSELLIKNYDLSSNSRILYLLNSIKYINVNYLMQLSEFGFSVISIGTIFYILSVNFLYWVCIFVRIINKKIKQRKYFYGKLFCNLIHYYTFVLFRPFCQILFTIVLCSKSVMSNMDIKCSQEDILYVSLFLLSCFCLILILINQWWICVYFVNNKQQKKDVMCIGKDPYFVFKYIFFQFLTVLTNTINISDYEFMIFDLCFKLIFSSVLYYSLCFRLSRFCFANQNVQQLFNIGFSIVLSQYYAFATDELARVLNVFPQKDEYILEWIFFYFFLFNFINSKFRFYFIEKKVLNPLIQNLSRNQLLLKICFLQTLVKENLDVLTDAFFKGIIHNHLQGNCLHDNQSEVCFCQLQQLYIAKNKKSCGIDKAFKKSNTIFFTKFLIKSWFEINLQKNQNKNFDLYLDYAELIFFKFQNIQFCLKILVLLQNKFLFPRSQFRFFILYQQILKYNRKKNKESYKSNLEIESVVQVEQSMEYIQFKIRSTVLNNIQFWQYLERANINYNEINQIIEFTFYQLLELKQKWVEIRKYLRFRKKWIFYFAWYYFYILNKKLKIYMLEKFQGTKINENDIFSEEIQNDLQDDIQSIGSNLKFEEVENVNIKNSIVAFDKNSLIINIDQDYKGNIKKVNRTSINIIGYSQKELEGKVNILQLMPRIFAEYHYQQMQVFTITGKTKSLYSQKKIFCLNKLGYIFPVWKFVKQYVTLNCKCDYITMIRPVNSYTGRQLNYIILNENWEIDSMSQIFYEILGINPLQYQNPDNKICLNLLILAPKLIQFTKFQKLQTKSDDKIFAANDVNREQQQSNPIFNKRRNNLASQVNKIDTQKGFSKEQVLDQSIKKQFDDKLQVIEEIQQEVDNNSTIFLSPQLQLKDTNFNQGKSSLLANKSENTENYKQIDNTIQNQSFGLLINQNKNGLNAFKKGIQNNNKAKQLQYVMSQSIGNHDENNFNENNKNNEQKIFSYDNEENVSFKIIKSQHINNISKEYYNLISKLNKSINDDNFFYKNIQILNSQYEISIYNIIKQLFTKYQKQQNNILYLCQCKIKLKKIVQKQILFFQNFNYQKITKDKDSKHQNYFSQISCKKENDEQNIKSMRSLDNEEPIYNQKKQKYSGYQIKQYKEKDQEEYENNSDQKLKEFQNDFRSKQGAKNFNLHQTNNIYIKEDNHKPNKQIQSIKIMKIFLRSFIFFIISLNFFVFFYIPHKEFPTLKKNSQKIFVIQEFILNLIIINNNIIDLANLNEKFYEKSLNNNKFYNNVTYFNLKYQRFKSLVNYFQTIKQTIDFKEIIYSNKLNQYQNIVYQVQGNNLSENQNTIDNYDLLNKFINLMYNLSIQNEKVIKYSKYEVKFMRENTFPHIYGMFESIQNNIISQLNSTANYLYNFLIITIIFQTCVILVSFVFLYSNIIRIFNTFQSIIDVFPKINQIDLKKIQNYNMNIIYNFDYILQKDSLICGLEINQNEQKQQQQQKLNASQCNKTL
ncbi:hypothetical protein IMG5_070680, partial [Ichthyophthirius multifiliis]